MRGTICRLFGFFAVATTCHAQTLGRPAMAEKPAAPGLVVGKSLPANPSLLPPVPVIYQTDFAEIANEPPAPPKIGELPKTPSVPGAKLAPTPGTSVVPLTPMPSTQVEAGVTLPKPAETILNESGNPKADDFTPKFKFKPGDNNLLQMETANGLFKFFAGGRLQIDGVWLRTNDGVQAARDAGGINNVRDAVNFRRARFDFGGTFYKNIDFLMEWDFINTVNVDPNFDTLPVNTPVPTDMHVTFRELPYVGNLRVGNQKPPIGFEHLISSRFLNFMERSLAFDAFLENQNNGFEPGVMVFDTLADERASWALGVFKNTRNIMGWNVGDGEYDLTGRVTYLPVYENDGEFLVHVGIGASHRDFDDNQERLRARLLLRNGPAVLHNIVAETRLGGSSRQQVVPEFAVVWGPITFMAEYYANWIRDAARPSDPQVRLGNAFFQGANAEILYFLTGDHQSYNRGQGGRAAFTRTSPRQNCRGFRVDKEGCDQCQQESGLGAWQLGVRWSWLDLDNSNIRGGTCHDITVGLNWFLNPYMKWQLNYSSLYRDAPGTANDGWVRGLGVRLAFDF